MMQSFLQTIVLRHRRENLKKCSLSGLEERPDMLFLKYPNCLLPDLTSYILLVVDDAPPLSAADKNKGLLILDSTWRYLDKMIPFVEQKIKLVRRTLPAHFITAYPRRQEDCKYPKKGLSSVEALFIAYHLLERDTEGLLDGYHWKEQFLMANKFN